MRTNHDDAVAAVFASLFDPINIFLGIGAGLISPTRYYSWWAVPILAVLPVALTLWRAFKIQQDIPVEQVLAIIVGWGVAFWLLHFVGFELRSLWMIRN